MCGWDGGVCVVVEIVCGVVVCDWWFYVCVDDCCWIGNWCCFDEVDWGCGCDGGVCVVCGIGGLFV